MSEVFNLAIPEEGALTAAEEALEQGGLVVVPTDTVYGLAARPDVPGSTDKVFAAKHRSQDLTLPILVPDEEDAADVGVLDERARALAAEFWPGGLTMILPRTDRSRPWDLGAARDTVGVRVPGHEVMLALLARTGPLAVTSANRSGETTPAECEEVRRALGVAVAVYLCEGRARLGVPSSILDLTGPDVRVVREGAIPMDLLRAVLGEVA
jgi:tRNA threonylcarbamoyl adenosine modification protein (Sua5/YciO/YrdC/YwlC family)